MTSSRHTSPRRSAENLFYLSLPRRATCHQKNVVEALQMMECINAVPTVRMRPQAPGPCVAVLLCPPVPHWFPASPPNLEIHILNCLVLSLL